MLAFDEPSHTYRWNGRVVPSVTQVIGHLMDDKLRFIDRDTLELARAKGIAIHKTIELHATGRLKRCPTWIEPMLAAWEKFVERYQFKLIAAEHRVYHEGMGYAGTIDLVGEVKGVMSIVDLKRTFLAGRVTGLQTSGYRRAWNEFVNGDARHAVNRYALVLGEDGEPKLEQFNDPADEATFLACVTMWKWQQKG